MDDIQIQTQYTVEDYIRTVRFIKYRNKPSEFIIVAGSVFISVFGLANLFLAYIAMNNMEFRKSLLLFFLSLCVFFSVYKILALYSGFLQMLFFKRYTRKHFDPDSILYSERQINFSEEGITETHKFGKYLTNWDAILRVIETDEDFLIYLHNIVRFQPKRDISVEQINPLRILIKANLRESAVFEYVATN